MSEEYIGREAAIAAACYGFCHPGVRCPDEPCREQTKYLRELPPADVVPVVRCKDCRYRVDPDKCCHPDGLLWSKNSDFCSYGERREE